mmetsp:Transcript_58166/g.103792  ORF Transcript_58166/g.103792 Transcript_58166/m.103792 type:complete len:211 (-) Transcript_58166:276-908(-)
MLLRLTPLNKARLKLPFDAIHHQYCCVCLCCTSDHVGDKVLMPRGIQEGDASMGRLEIRHTYVDGHPSGPFLLLLVQQPCKMERGLALLTGLLLMFVHHLLADQAQSEEDVAHYCTLAGIHMAHNHNAQPVLTIIIHQRLKGLLRQGVKGHAHKALGCLGSARGEVEGRLGFHWGLWCLVLGWGRGRASLRCSRLGESSERFGLCFGLGC